MINPENNDRTSEWLLLVQYTINLAVIWLLFKNSIRKFIIAILSVIHTIYPRHLIRVFNMSYPFCYSVYKRILNLSGLFQNIRIYLSYYILEANPDVCYHL